jgi:hypothetical protein
MCVCDKYISFIVILVKFVLNKFEQYCKKMQVGVDRLTFDFKHGVPYRKLSKRGPSCY